MKSVAPASKVQRLFLLNDSQMKKITNKRGGAQSPSVEQSGGVLDLEGELKRKQIGRVQSKITQLLKPKRLPRKKGEGQRRRRGRKQEPKRGRVSRGAAGKVLSAFPTLNEKDAFKYEKFKRLQAQIQNALEWFQARTAASLSGPQLPVNVPVFPPSPAALGAAIKSEAASRRRKAPRVTTKRRSTFSSPAAAAAATETAGVGPGGRPRSRPGSLKRGHSGVADERGPIKRRARTEEILMQPRTMKLRSDKKGINIPESQGDDDVFYWETLGGTREPIHDKILDLVKSANKDREEGGLQNFHRLMEEQREARYKSLAASPRSRALSLNTLDGLTYGTPKRPLRSPLLQPE